MVFQIKRDNAALIINIFIFLTTGLILTLIRSTHLLITAIYLIYFIYLLWSISIQYVDEFKVLLFYIYAYVTAALSTFLCENGVYLMEIQRFTFPNGSTIKSITLVFILVATSVYFSTLLQKHFTLVSGRKKIINYIDKIVSSFSLVLILCLLSLLLFAITFFLDGIPILNLSSTIQFSQSRSYSNLWYFASILQRFAIILLGFKYSITISDKHKKYIIILFILFLIVRVLNSEKFSGLIIDLFIFYLPLLLKNKKRLLNPKYVFGGGALIFLFYNLILLNYKILHNSIINAEELLKIRLALQGQLWWVSPELDFKAHDSLIKGLSDLGIVSGSQNQGIQHLMEISAPKGVFLGYITNGVRFTMGFPTILTSTLPGILPYLILMFCGILLGFYIFLIINSFRVSNGFVYLLSLQIYFVLMEPFIMGEFEALRSKSFLIISLFLFLVIASNMGIKKSS